MRAYLTLGVLICTFLLVLEASSNSGSFQDGGVIRVDKALTVRYGYIHYRHRRVLFYYRGHPRIYHGHPHCARRCYIKYCYIRRRRVPVYHFTSRPVYGYVHRRSRRVRIVYIRRPHYFINRGRTCVLRGPSYRNYRGVRVVRSSGTVFHAGHKGCYYHGRLVRFGDSCTVSKCNVCHCTARDGFAHLKCHTDRQCVLENMKRPAVKGHGYSVDSHGCNYQGTVIPFGSKSRISKCKVCSCSGTSRSATVRCQIDNACLRGYCLYKGYKMPFGRSLVAGCQLCSCTTVGGHSKIVCKTDEACLRKAADFASKKPDISVPSTDFVSSSRSHCLYHGNPVKFYHSILVNKCQTCTCVPRGSVPTFYCHKTAACKSETKVVHSAEEDRDKVCRYKGEGYYSGEVVKVEHGRTCICAKVAGGAVIRCHKKLPEPTHIDYRKDTEHSNGGLSSGNKGGTHSGSNSHTKTHSGSNSHTKTHSGSNSHTKTHSGSNSHTKTVVDKTEDVFRNKYGCFYKGQFAKYDHTLQLKQCYNCICRRKPHKMFLCQKRAECKPGHGDKKPELCTWAGLKYTLGQTFRLPKCRVCTCKSGSVVKCHFDEDCRQGASQQSAGISMTCHYNGVTYQPGSLFTVKPCRTCVCSSKDHHPRILCRYSPQCFSDQYVHQDVRYDGVFVNGRRVADRPGSPDNPYLPDGSGRTMSDVGGRPGLNPRRMPPGQMVHGSGGPIHHSEVDQARTAYVRVEEGEVEKSARPRGDHGPIDAKYFFRRHDHYFGDSVHHDHGGSHHHKTHHSKHHTTHHTKHHTEHHTTHHTNPHTTHHTEQLGHDDTPLTGDVLKTITGPVCRYQKKNYSQGSVLHLHKCTACTCSMRGTTPVFRCKHTCVEHHTSPGINHHDSGSDHHGSGSDHHGSGSDHHGSESDHKGSESDHHDSGSDHHTSPIKGDESGDSDSTGYAKTTDYCLLGKQIVSFGSKIQYGRCNHCTCVKSNEGPLFLCDKLSGCEEERALPAGSTKPHYGDGAGLVEDQTDTDSVVERNTKVKTVPTHEEKAKGCMYRGSLISFSSKIRIPPCQMCTCVEQDGKNPVFVCKDICNEERKDEKEKGPQGKGYKDTGGRSNKDDNRWGSRKHRFHIDDKHDSNDVHSSRYGNFRHGPPQRLDKNGKVIHPADSHPPHSDNSDIKYAKIVEFSKTVDGGVSDGASTWSSAADRRRNTPITTGGVQFGFSSRPSLGGSTIRDTGNTDSEDHGNSFGVVRRMKFGKGYVVGEDTGDSVCSYGGITVPVNSRVFISSCKLCKCVQAASHHGPRLVCYWREHCVRTGPVPGCHVSGVVVPRDQQYGVGRCTTCSCQYGFNGFQTSCSTDHHCNSHSRPSHFQVPTELPIEEYEDPKFKSGCRLHDGNVVMQGDTILDNENCNTCHCDKQRLTCKKRSCAKVKRAAGCFLGDLQIKQGSHIGRGCKRCVCNGYGVFVCKFDYNCVVRQTRPSLNCYSGEHKVPHGTTRNIGCKGCSCRRGKLTCHQIIGCNGAGAQPPQTITLKDHDKAKPAGKGKPKGEEKKEEKKEEEKEEKEEEKEERK
ncbi:hypothetical protein ACHWQZ_G017586 [Mnemiopsis leidyi]